MKACQQLQQLFCSRENQLTSRFNQQNEKSTSNVQICLALGNVCGGVYIKILAHGKGALWGSTPRPVEWGSFHFSVSFEKLSIPVLNKFIA